MALLVTDRLAEMIFYLDGVYCRAFYKLDAVMVDNYGMSLLSICDDLKQAYNSVFAFVNSFEVVKLIKAFEDYVNGDANRIYDNDALLNSKVMIALRELHLFLLYVYCLSLILLFLYAKITKWADAFQFYFSKFLNEIDNNLSNFKDVRNLALTFIFILNFFFFMFSYFKYGLTVTIFFFFMIALNVKTVVVYLYFYNLNVYVYIKGLLSKVKVMFNFIIDNITLSIFVSRLVLQFIRLLICSAIFFL